MVYSADGAAGKPYDLTYRLDQSNTLTPSALTLPETYAQSLSFAESFEDDLVTTLFITHWDRMQSLYGSDTTTLRTEVGALIDERARAQQASVLIDLGADGLNPGDELRDRYVAWDNDPTNPLMANAVAENIKMVIAEALRRYPNVNALVIVGSDSVVPFYRVRDETAIANERRYIDESGRLPGTGTPTRGALESGAITTDDYYASRRPAAWRGRELHLPELAIGRLVEKPADIVAYLRSYTASSGFPRIDLAGADAGAFVSGYDFLNDQARELVATLQPALRTGAVSELLGGDPPWNRDALVSRWQPTFPDYDGSGARSPHQLAAINAHFSHYQAIPADLRRENSLQATSIYNEPANLLNPAAAYFAGTLAWSVGCHSGYNLPDEQLGGQDGIDFPQAMLKHGGNWVGNTGFGFGYTDAVAYSERLSLLFGQELVRDTAEPNTIGAALMRAKQRYLRSSGPLGFGVYDEKVLIQTTLYGLSFTEIAVANPQVPDDPDIVPPPPAIPAREGVFTRIITIDGSVGRIPSERGVGDVPRWTGSLIEDSLLPVNERPELYPDISAGLGTPILPLLMYDLTLQFPGDEYPQVRGVKLIEAEYSDSADFDPVVTRVVTQGLRYSPGVELEPPFATDGRLFPERPFAYNVVDTLAGPRTQLSITPAQYRSTTENSGTLRGFSRMTFEVTYVYGEALTPDVAQDTLPPRISQTNLTFQPEEPWQGTLTISTVARDDGDIDSGLASVIALVSSAGHNSRQVVLTPAGNGLYRADIPVRAYDPPLEVVIQALDQAGNNAYDGSKAGAYIFDPAAAMAPFFNYLPIIRR